MTIARILCVVPLAVGASILLAPVAGADRAQPVPLYGSYDTFLDHSRQTFNDRPDISEPSVQAASFATTCVASGCVAHWLRLTELTENPNAPALFDYQWVNDRWVSTGEYPFPLRRRRRDHDDEVRLPHAQWRRKFLGRTNIHGHRTGMPR